jgi:hypothetical protein
MWFVHWQSSLNLDVITRTIDGKYYARLKSKDPEILVYVSENVKDIGNPPTGMSESSTLHAEMVLIQNLVGRDLVLNHKNGSHFLRFPIPNLRYLR